MKVLIVDPDVNRIPPLKMALAAAGAEVTIASSGSFALTMLEWNRHDVVVSRARIDDMDGRELCAILKSDPSTRHVRFALLAGPEEVTTAQTTAAGVDLVVPAALPAGEVAPMVMQLLAAQAAPPAPAPIVAKPPAAAPARTAAGKPAAPATVRQPDSAVAAPSAVAAALLAPAGTTSAPTRPAPTVLPKLGPPAAAPVPEPPKRYVTAAAAAAAAPWVPSAPPAAGPSASLPAPAPPAVDLAAMPSGTFQGTLEVMDLADLTQAMAMGRKTGRLILALSQGGGLVVFEAGRVVHAEFCGAVGEAAFGALLTAAQGATTGRFCFLPGGDGPSPTRTIDKSVDRLLLSIATAIDEKG